MHGQQNIYIYKKKKEHKFSHSNSQRDALFLKFIVIKYSTCFGHIYCPSSGVSTLYKQQIGICLVSYVDRLPARSGSCPRWQIINFQERKDRSVNITVVQTCLPLDTKHVCTKTAARSANTAHKSAFYEAQDGFGIGQACTGKHRE